MRRRILICLALLLILSAGGIWIYIDNKKDSERSSGYSYDLIGDSDDITGNSHTGIVYVRVDILRESHPGNDRIERLERELERLRAERADYIREMYSSLEFVENEYGESRELASPGGGGNGNENISSWDNTVKMASQRLKRFENMIWEDVEDKLYNKMEEFNAEIDESVRKYREKLREEMKRHTESVNGRYYNEILDLRIRLAANELAPYDKAAIEERLAQIHREITSEIERKEIELDSEFRLFLEILMEEKRKAYDEYKEMLMNEAIGKIDEERENIAGSLNSVRKIFEDYDEKMLRDSLGRERVNTICSVIRGKIERIGLEYNGRIFDIIARKGNLQREIEHDLMRSIRIMEQRIGRDLYLVDGDTDVDLSGAVDLTSKVLDILVMGG